MKQLRLGIALVGLIVVGLIACQEKAASVLYPQKSLQIEPEKAADLAQKIRAEVAAAIDDGLELSLWASDTLVNDPIAISIDPNGRIFYTKASRQGNSEFDIRGHRNWMTASISFETVEDRRAFLRETFSADSEESVRHLKDLNGDGVRDWRDLTVEKEQVWFVEDGSGDGIADRAQLYIEDYNEEITDVANGIEFHNGEVFIGTGPDLWRTKDTNGDGIADESESISHGYAVHIGFSGHGMSGVKVGPQGRIWWGIGDIGMNVVDKEGKRWKYPNQGVVVRSEPDGTNFEVYSAGVRNTHEFVFDEYGNLISEDNDGDHRGERERLVYLINGSDCGWRTNWQFGKYTDPDNNSYKVWMDEKLSIPHWDGQAAYILPPIQNYINGPTGMVYNPGTALGPEWYNHFFIAEFRGSPANSPIHAFTLEPDGASFKLSETKEVVRGVLPTGIDFGPDGAMYFSDWIDGWGLKKEGRIWKMDVPGEVDSPIRQETKALIQADFTSKDEVELSKLLGHQDQRVRQKAQFELADRGAKGQEIFLSTIKSSVSQLARIHSLWGLNQLARKDQSVAANFVPYLADQDAEIIAQATKMIGDVRYDQANTQLMELLKHESLRVRLLAAEALGRLEAAAATPGLIEMLRENNDEDIWLRHAGMIALARVADGTDLVALQNDPSKAVRTAAVVALRRLKDAGVAEFLDDDDEHIVTEAARAINDDYNIKPALPALAEILDDTPFQNEALIRRVINANVEVGEQTNWERLLKYTQKSDAPAVMRAEALAALSTWAKPSVFDRVDGRYRGPMERDAEAVKTAAAPILASTLAEGSNEVKIAAMQAAGRLGAKDLGQSCFGLLTQSSDATVRSEALKALQKLEYPELEKALAMALEDNAKEVRSTALALLPESDLPAEQSVPLFENILADGSVEEKQATLAALKNYKNEAAKSVLSGLTTQLVDNELQPEIQLDLIEAIEAMDDQGLNDQLAKYEANKDADDPVSQYKEALYGGNARQGARVFYGNEAAQCVRCHAVFEYGGNAGPGLAGVADRLSREELLQSMVAPSAAYSPGYGVVILEMNDGASVSGINMGETDSQLTLKIGKEDIQTIDKANIKTRENIPSSMPVMGDVLNKRQLRNLVAFLGTLHEEEG
ncbi:MAG: HEAT repeat domain-containing protein [Bacteroidota bacterium]